MVTQSSRSSDLMPKGGLRHAQLMSRILVGDDEPEAGAIVEKMLRQLGHEVTRAVNGLEALRREREQAFDLILVDLFMSEMDGFETITALRRESPAAKVIAISESIFAQPMLSVALRLGCKGVLEKPFTLHQLPAVLKEAS